MASTAHHQQQARQAQHEVARHGRELGQTMNDLNRKLRDLQIPLRNAANQQRDLLRHESGSRGETSAYDRLSQEFKKLQDQLNALGKQLTEHANTTQSYMQAKAKLKEAQERAKQQA